jgi:hypothetical protein
MLLNERQRQVAFGKLRSQCYGLRKSHQYSAEQAFDQDADVRFRLKHDVLVQPPLPSGGEGVPGDEAAA